MPAFKTGTVARIVDESADLIRMTVRLNTGEIAASGFPSWLGPVKPGDRVVVNTTGLELDLGTGGEGFVLWNLDGRAELAPGPGHIMKMRYTPWQTEVLAAEEPDSPHHAALRDITSVGGMPVVACGLHSQIGAVAAGIKAAEPEMRVGYLMTDGGALPLAWSRSVVALRAAGLIDATCTSGHSFGGDLESVNVLSGLVALRHAARMDAVVVAMGPGVVGTGTALGTTALEQGPVLDGATALGGVAIAALRIAFVDQRRRHVGVSHHSLTALTIAASRQATVAVPQLPEAQARQVAEQLEAAGVAARHRLVVADAGPGLRELAGRGLKPSSMGRSQEEVPELFAAAAAAGRVAAEAQDPAPRDAGG